MATSVMESLFFFKLCCEKSVDVILKGLCSAINWPMV